MNQKLSKEIFQAKYMVNGERSVDEVIEGVSLEIARAETSPQNVVKYRAIFSEQIRSGKLIPAGRILANARSNPKMPFYNNCYTIGLEDSMESITKGLADYMTIQKTGGGVGKNISKLRPKGFPISKGGVSSGPLSYAEIFNTAATTISSAGGRRGATMLMLDCDHPDVEEFIQYKKGDDNKALTQMNISVVVTDEFMDCAINDKPWDLKFNGVVIKTVKAKELMDAIIQNNFDYAEPGIMFKTTANRVNNIYYDASMEMIVTNPCGEIIGAPNFVCCLSAVNLAKFVGKPFTGAAYFKVEEFADTITAGVRFLDNVLTRTKYPIPEIEEQAHKYRRIGLGITALADMLAMMGLKYGSDEAVDFTDGIMRIFRDTSYRASVNLAKEKGRFPEYKDDFLFGGFVSQLPLDIQEEIAEYGIRNAYLGTVAPTGTTSLSLGNNCSSGVEPIFALKYNRSYRVGDDINEKATDTVYNNAYLEFLDMPEVDRDTPLPDYFVTSEDLSIEDHLKMQSVVQKYIDQSVSKTITLPTGSSMEDMKDVYIKAWKMGLKGCTVFNPDGKLASVIFTDDKKPSVETTERPEILPCEVKEFMHKGTRHYAFIGMLNDTPYEVFVIQNPEENFRKWVGDFAIKRVKSDHYSLEYNGETVIAELAENFGFNEEIPFTCLAVSSMMRSSMTMSKIVETLNKKTLVTSFPKALGRVLKNFIDVDDGEVHCPDCDEPMNRVEGCYVCPSCGYGKCG